MALTREYYRALQDRAKRDPKFKKELLAKAINAYFSENYKTGKGTLRQLIHATIGFESLGKEIKKSSKSIHRMLGPKGNPNTANFFAMLSVLQRQIDVHLTGKIIRAPSQK